jgi:predicted permease
MFLIAPGIAVPGTPELLVLLLVGIVPFALAYWVYADARDRGDEYALNWAITVFLTSLFSLFPGTIVVSLYREVRE